MTVQFSPETANFLIEQNQIKDPASVINSANTARIVEAAQEFEAVFFAEMLKPMFDGLEVNDMFGGGKGEEIFRGMMIQEYGKEFAKKNISGIQTAVQSKLLEIQEQRSSEMSAGKILDLEILEEQS